MTIIEILKLLFTKIADKESINKFFDSLLNMPKRLKCAFMFVLLLGVVYFGYSKIYTSELMDLRLDLTEIKKQIECNITQDTYDQDIFYLIEAITICEEVNAYEYEEKQLTLDLIKNYIKRSNPNDPLIRDIDAMKQRNTVNHELYTKEFKKILEKCQNDNVKNSVNNTLEKNNIKN